MENLEEKLKNLEIRIERGVTSYNEKINDFLKEENKNSLFWTLKEFSEVISHQYMKELDKLIIEGANNKDLKSCRKCRSISKDLLRLNKMLVFGMEILLMDKEEEKVG